METNGHRLITDTLPKLKHWLFERGVTKTTVKNEPETGFLPKIEAVGLASNQIHSGRLYPHLLTVNTSMFARISPEN